MKWPLMTAAWDGDANQSADLVAITAMTAQAPAAYSLADQYRARGIPVVLGGIHPSMCPEEAGQHADAVVLGEADRVWPDLVQDFAHGRMKSRYHDPEPIDLAQIASPRRDLLDPRLCDLQLRADHAALPLQLQLLLGDHDVRSQISLQARGEGH